MRVNLKAGDLIFSSALVIKLTFLTSFTNEFIKHKFALFLYNKSFSGQSKLNYHTK